MNYHELDFPFYMAFVIEDNYFIDQGEPVLTQAHYTEWLRINKNMVPNHVVSM